MNKILFIIVLIILCISLITSCGEKSGVSGVVVDPAGMALAAVTAKVVGSSFTSDTDTNGIYLLDYAPGEFTIEYSKTGYTTHLSKLNIASQTRFPSDTVILYPIPEISGIYVLESGLLGNLNEFMVKERKRSQSWPPRNFSTFYLPKVSDLPIDSGIKEGTITFIDTYPKSLKLARLNNNGYIQDYSYSFGDRKYSYNGLLNDKMQKVGKENIALRTVLVKPGIYAWVQVVNTMMGNTIPKANKNAFAFRVTPIQADTLTNTNDQ